MCSLLMFGLKFCIDDSFVVSNKCVCVNYYLLGHFSHFMSAGGIVHTHMFCVTLHLLANLQEDVMNIKMCKGKRVALYHSMTNFMLLSN